MPNPSKPTSWKVLSGNPGKRRMRNNPEPPPLLAEPPDWLDDVAKAFWAETVPELVACGIARSTDRAILEVLAATYSRWQKACDQVDAEGATFTTDSGLVKRHPAAAVEASAAAMLRGLFADCGMTPASRARLHVAPPSGPQDKLRLLDSADDEEAYERFLNDDKPSVAEFAAAKPRPNPEGA